MLNYEPITEAEAMAERFQLLKEGVYDAVITASSDSQSKTGNPMMDMTVSVYDDNGRAHDIRDFLVFTKAMMWKVIRFADSADILKEYESGKLCSEVAIGKRVKVKVVVEEGNEIPAEKLKGKPEGTCYPDKNKIAEYIKRDEAIKNTSNTAPFDDDDIAF